MGFFKGNGDRVSVGRQGAAQVRRRSRWVPVLAVVALVATLGLVGCSSDSKDPIAVAGVWQLASSGEGWTSIERWTITDDSIHYQSSSDGDTFTTTYRATIVEYVNGRLNAGDTALIDGRAVTTNPGFAIIRFTEVNNAGTGEVGKYNVFRWADNNADSALRDFGQGYVNIGGEWPDNINGVFDTAAAAETGATNEAGYFGFASSGASRQ